MDDSVLCVKPEEVPDPGNLFWNLYSFSDPLNDLCGRSSSSAYLFLLSFSSLKNWECY